MRTTNTSKFNILVGQSGGPTAAINSSLYGVITASLEKSAQINRIYGMLNGIEGFLEDSYIDLTKDLSPGDLELLPYTPAAYLGTCRYKLPTDLSDGLFPIIFEKFTQLNIGYFLYIGGNDSMDTVSKLSHYAKQVGNNIRIIGIPKTIDNDLVETDHTPGFGSAAKYVASTVREITLDSSVYHTKSVTIIELMGRHAGWITASSVLARKYPDDNPVLIYLPEQAFSMEQFIKDLTLAFESKQNLIVCVSEGIKDKEGKLICESEGESKLDTFGHKMLTGCGKVLEDHVRTHLGVKVRSVELNVSQRCSGLLTSSTDLSEAATVGRNGVEAALNGVTGKMISMVRISNTPYRLDYQCIDVDLICNQEKSFPMEWISEDGKDIEDAFLTYVTPLIQGEPVIQMSKGLPVYCFRKL